MSLACEAEARERAIDRERRRGGEPLRRLRRAAVADDARQRREPVLLHRALAGEDERGRAVVDLRGVGGGDGAVLLEGGLERSASSRAVALGLVVFGDHDLLALFAGDLDGGDLGLERAFLLRGDARGGSSRWRTRPAPRASTETPWRKARQLRPWGSWLYGSKRPSRIIPSMIAPSPMR